MFKRIFIVGCPRSGTTFLQSLLAAHPKLTSYPETHFWDYTIPKKKRYRLPKVYTIREKKLIREFLQKYDFSLEAMAGMKPLYFSYKSWSKALMEVLDNLTSDEFDGWIEKTPRHIYSVPFITAADSNARFIHIIREARDVVASLYQVTHEYPEHWNGPKDIDDCIQKWKEFIDESHKYLDQPRHSFVRYEELLERKEEITAELCEFIGLEYSSEMLQDYTDEAEKLVNQNEKWKESNIKGRDKTDKFTTLFSTEEQEYIKERTKHVSLAPFSGKIKRNPGDMRVTLKDAN